MLLYFVDNIWLNLYAGDGAWNLWNQQWGKAYRLRLDMIRRTHIECLLVILLTEVVNNTKDFGNFVLSNHHKQEVFNY